MSATDGVPDAKRPEPPVVALTGQYWEATRQKTLLIQWCDDCEIPITYPRVVCPTCLGERLSWRPSTGTGSVYAVTVEHRPQDPRRSGDAPYAVALVDLDDGGRLLSNVETTSPHEVAVGDRVTVTWEPLTDGRNLPLFTPTGEDDA